MCLTYGRNYPGQESKGTVLKPVLYLTGDLDKSLSLFIFEFPHVKNRNDNVCIRDLLGGLSENVL